MIRYNPNKNYPQIDNTTYTDPTAVIIGKVKIGGNVYVGPGAVIRADEPGSSIIVGNNCNIQDKVVIHALERTSVEIDKNTSLAHGCIVHGPCRIGRSCFIEFGSVVFASKLAEGVMVKHLAVIEGVNIPARRLVLSGSIINTPDKVKHLEVVSKRLREFCQGVIKTNLKLTKGYLENG